MNTSKLIVLASLAVFSLGSCGGGDKSEELETGDSTKAVESPNSAVSETFFQVPSPGEMLSFIKMVGGKTNKNTSFLNPLANEKKYVDGKSRAINFGIYGCDLSYCSIFEIGSESIKYFKTVKVMGDQIGVSTAIKPEMLKRLESNVSNPDSLAIITDDIYFSSFETLEDSKQGPTLALVVAGGWIESIYIATQLAKYEAGSPIVERLADQKYTCENLVEFLRKHESDANVAAVKADFESLLAEFNKIQEKDAEAPKASANDKMTMTGGKQLVMSEENYKAITSKIASIRNAYTQTN